MGIGRSAILPYAKLPALGKGIVSPSGSRGWTARYINNSDVLFIGEISKISDGKLYNQKKDATDYLTVAGSAGSYTFQAPNTEPYIAADTDLVWFNPDASQRLVTETELVGYDLQKTPIKYDNNSPYTIRAIMILSSSILGSAKDRMFRDFWLSIFWDDTWNDNGYLKENRGLEQKLWSSDFVFETETEALVERMTTAPTTQLKALINNTIISYKESGIWAKRDYISHFNLHTEQASLLNWKGDYFNWSKISTLTWEQFLGFTATGSGQYLTNTYKESTEGIILQLNNACLTNKFNSWVMGTGTQMSGSIGTDNTTTSRIWYVNGKYIGLQSSNVATTADVAKAAIVNIGRTNNTKIRVRVDGVFAVELNSNSIGLVNNAESALAQAAGSYLMTNKRLCYTAKGAYLTDEEAAIEKAIVENFDTQILLI